jgi:hypothetical protein
MLSPTENRGVSQGCRGSFRYEALHLSRLASHSGFTGSAVGDVIENLLFLLPRQKIENQIEQQVVVWVLAHHASFPSVWTQDRDTSQILA